MKHSLVPSTGTSVSYVSSVVVLRLLPMYMTASLESVFTKTLTRALTHTLGSTLTHTLSAHTNRKKDTRSKKDIDRNNIEREYYLNHDASYYSDYYADFYTGNPNPRPSSDGELLYTANPKEVISEKNKKNWQKGEQHK